MSYVVFENPGVIDLRTISLFGVSVKKTDNPIGQFGTGLKYAVPILIRAHQKITLQAGEQVCTFRTEQDAIREAPVDLIYMNDTLMPFVLDHGKKWELWMGYRELWSNTKDEGGLVYVTDEKPMPTAGVTRFIVEGEAFLEVHRERGTFLLNSDEKREPIQVIAGKAEAYPGKNRSVFFRGIKVHELPEDQEALYTWNILADLTLTEDRTAKYSWEVMGHISSAIVESSDVDFIEEVIRPGRDTKTLEAKLDFSEAGTRWTQPKEHFLQAVDKAMQLRAAEITPSAFERFKEIKKQDLAPASTRLSSVEEKQFLRAAKFLQKHFGVDLTDYVLRITDSLGQNVRGMAKGNTIYVSRLAFDQGTKIVAGVLFEEWCHLRYGYLDETRSFQNFLLDKLMSIAESKERRPL